MTLSLKSVHVSLGGHDVGCRSLLEGIKEAAAAGKSGKLGSVRRRAGASQKEAQLCQSLPSHPPIE